MHERVKGEFDFSGALDVAEFLRKAQSRGLMAIVRPGPYICAEWEFAVLNGFNLGRHWCVGPQRTLFVPASVLKKGENGLIVFDSDGAQEGCYALFTDTPELGEGK